MKVTIIVMMDQRNGIGRENGLVLELPEDLAHFKRTTMGHHVVMGRKTYESIGRPLPGREVVVMTKNRDYPLPGGVLRAGSLEEALGLCIGDEEVFIAGGATVYREAIKRADRLLVTEVETESPSPDAYFPTIDREEWRYCKAGEWQTSRNGYRYRILEYTRG
jgi:hypothetical protein